MFAIFQKSYLKYLTLSVFLCLKGTQEFSVHIRSNFDLIFAQISNLNLLSLSMIITIKSTENSTKIFKREIFKIKSLSKSKVLFRVLIIISYYTRKYLCLNF